MDARTNTPSQVPTRCSLATSTNVEQASLAESAGLLPPPPPPPLHAPRFAKPPSVLVDIPSGAGISARPASVNGRGGTGAAVQDVASASAIPGAITAGSSPMPPTSQPTPPAAPTKVGSTALASPLGELGKDSSCGAATAAAAAAANVGGALPPPPCPASAALPDGEGDLDLGRRAVLALLLFLLTCWRAARFSDESTRASHSMLLFCGVWCGEAVQAKDWDGEA